MHILVISLPGAEARRRLMRAQLELPGMPPHRLVDAVDGSALSGRALAAVYDDAASQRYVGRSLTPGEIGCAASHLSAYRNIVAERLPMTLVLEDDALLGHLFLEVLERLVPMVQPHRPQAVLLSHVLRYSMWGSQRVDRHHRLCRPYLTYGSHAYLLTLSGAQALLGALHPISTVADDWRRFGKLVHTRAVVPYLVGTSPMSASSQIGSERLLPSRPRRSRLLRLADKLSFQLVVKPVLRLRRQKQAW